MTMWASDFDVLDSDYVENPFPIWDELRATCPVAHSTRRGRTWLPTRYEDVTAIAHDIEHFSSLEVSVIPFTGEDSDDPILAYGLPPISSDPPIHTWTRRLLLPWFSHRRVESYEPFTRDFCRRLLAGFSATGRADAAKDYAQQIPVFVVAHILGVPPEMADTFTSWVRDILEFAHDEKRRIAAMEGIVGYLLGEIERRRHEPGSDLLSELVSTKVDGRPIEDSIVLGIAALVLIAGVDTTWSAIGSSLWHLATHAEDRHRLVHDRDVWPLAIEELLRAYAPVTMARLVSSDVDFAGCPMKRGDRVLMSFPAANRDPEVFEEPHTVLLDRTHNRHVAFGSGIHRCAGSNLARLELRVALEEWLAAIPDFSLADRGEVRWAGGQVRGPRSLPVVF